MAGMISAVVLAAGRAQTMGEQKVFLPLQGKPVLQWVLESALKSDLHEVICVVRDLASARQRIALVHERLFWLVNHAADRGQSTSVIAGLWATDPKSHGTLFLTGDQPMIRCDLFPELLQLTGDRGGRVLVEKYLDKTELLDWPDEAPFMDIDVRENYER